MSLITVLAVAVVWHDKLKDMVGICLFSLNSATSHTVLYASWRMPIHSAVWNVRRNDLSFSYMEWKLSAYLSKEDRTHCAAAKAEDFLIQEISS